MSGGALHVVAAATVGAGLSLTVTGMLLRVQRRQRSLAELLDLAGGEAEVPVEVVTESPEAPSVSRLTARMGDLLGQLDTRGALTRALDRADLPLRAGEYLFLVAATVVGAGLLVGYVSGSWPAGIVASLVPIIVARSLPKHRARGRQDRLRAQLPDAFSLIASSVAGGHTFLRSIQLLGEQIPRPLSVELNIVTAEVMLGSHLIDALDSMARRSEIIELRWAVKAVRIQQSTGGQLAEILHTLADFMRAREEVHREVRVLTAEGRFSAWVLMALPVFVSGWLVVTDPGYLRPLVRGWGFFFLGLAVSMLVVGFVIIRRLVDVEV